MRLTRRHVMSTAAAAGTMTVLPFAARAESRMTDVFETSAGDVSVHPVSHASFVMETPAGTIYVDPVGQMSDYEDFPPADLLLVTHEHGDHYNAQMLQALMGDETHLITNGSVHGMLPDALAERAERIDNGGSTEWNGVTIDAIPAYNITEDRLQFHPEGRDNGYVLTMGDDFRVYISGDTEDIPEMRALENISLAFVCMNLPFTMTAEAAADAVNTFKPAVVYPYHYRGRDGGTQDPEAFASMVEGDSQVKLGDWYAPGET